MPIFGFSSWSDMADGGGRGGAGSGFSFASHEDYKAEYLATYGWSLTMGPN